MRISDWSSDVCSSDLLEAVAAACFGVAARQVCVVPGTEIGLRLVGALIGGEARYVAPGYRTHGEMISGAMATDPDGIGRHGGSIVLANPNNPEDRKSTRLNSSH